MVDYILSKRDAFGKVSILSKIIESYGRGVCGQEAVVLCSEFSELTKQTQLATELGPVLHKTRLVASLTRFSLRL